MTHIIDGKKIASDVQDRLAKAISNIKGRKPGLAFIRVGQLAASKIYITMKKKKCQEVGIHSIDIELDEATTEESLINEIKRLNNHPDVDGILVQLPLPDHIDTRKIIETIHPDKDVDGFHPINMGKLLIGDHSGFQPCTPLGIHVLLSHSRIPILGKKVVIVGRSNIVGKPLAALLMQKAPNCNATVTLAHSLSENLSEICKSADILIAAIGKAHFIKKEMVKQGATVIDVGINKIIDNNSLAKIVGDVDYDSVAPLCSHITPVPGGVGPMTIAMLLSNTLLSFQRRNNPL
jgi:methylenetetrahydrofolate dehydrogenase (NADP+)/methenyltetrahydrofolate cyclohydrolase